MQLLTKRNSEQQFNRHEEDVARFSLQAEQKRDELRKSLNLAKELFDKEQEVLKEKTEEMRAIFKRESQELLNEINLLRKEKEELMKPIDEIRQEAERKLLQAQSILKQAQLTKQANEEERTTLVEAVDDFNEKTAMLKIEINKGKRFNSFLERDSKKLSEEKAQVYALSDALSKKMSEYDVKAQKLNEEMAQFEAYRKQEHTIIKQERNKLRQEYVRRKHTI